VARTDHKGEDAVERTLISTEDIVKARAETVFEEEKPLVFQFLF